MAASAVVLVPLGFFWQRSLLPDSYSAGAMGTPAYGGGPQTPGMHGRMPGTVSVADLTADPKRKADAHVDLEAEQRGDRYALNGSTPGPTIRVRQGQLLEVRLSNRNVRAGVTLHWHGVDVPNAEDGVAGVTQDAVMPGRSFTYRFVAKDAGTFWYHSHQMSHEQVVGGLFGALVIEPAGRQVPDVLAVSHVFGGVATLNGRDDDVRAKGSGARRVRIVNTDNGTLNVWSSASYAVAAIDGRELSGPTVSGRVLRIPAGGRADLMVTPVPGRPVRVEIGGARSVIVGDGPVPAAPSEPTGQLDLLSYGTPASLPFDVTHPERRFTYDIGRRPGFLDGKPGWWWTVNGHLWPDTPMYMVDEGDLVQFTIHNGTGDAHPMHLHGHHAVVLSRDGKPATGSRWWVDSLDVEPGETYVIAFLADNPGIWLDHCHNLPHAAQGLIAHLMYQGVTTPFRIGGTARNEPE